MSFKNLEKKINQLFYWGDYNLSTQLANNISVVGTRQVSEYGKFLCQNLVRELAKYHCNIVSGLARGIDSIAHKTALDNDLKTIAVLGCGLKANGVGDPRLMQEIMRSPQGKNNLILSEYPDRFHAQKQNFLERNRIIAALGKLTIVVEASIVSGSLSTARHAIKQGKKVYTFAGEIGKENFAGNNMLLNAGQAEAIFSIEDFVAKLDLENKASTSTQQTSQDPILKAIPKRGIRMDDLLAKMKLSYSEISASLSLLEIEGKVEISANLIKTL